MELKTEWLGDGAGSPAPVVTVEMRAGEMPSDRKLASRRYDGTRRSRPATASLRFVFSLACGALAFGISPRALAFDRPDVTFQVFQFPRDQMPRIDGDGSDWSIVPESYAIGMDQFVEDGGKFKAPVPENLDVKIRVGWVKGLNRLYFLYEAYDNNWDFAGPGLRNDTFEIVVDGDASGGPLIDKAHKDLWTRQHVGELASRPDPRVTNEEAHWSYHGVHAQNYHIFTPALDKDWCMAWGSATWIKEFPWSNASYRYEFKPGQPGKLVLEFWITPFDYAGPEGPSRAVPSDLRENKMIGLGLIVIDYDGREPRGFWNLSRHHTSYGDASELCGFKLMPLESAFLPDFQARWSFTVVDPDRKVVAFTDESVGEVKGWKWDFGDGQTSNEQHPVHTYTKAGTYVTVLEITGSDGKTSRRSKVWDVQLR